MMTSPHVSCRARHNYRSRRGSAAAELLVASLLIVLIGMTLFTQSRFMSQVYFRSTATVNAKNALYLATERLSPDIRTALRINLAASNANRLTLVQPRKDAAGGYILPLASGSSVAFYLSDTTGAAGRSGTILWRAVDGVPDTAWSLQSGGRRGRTDLGETTGLTFSFPAGTDPRSVRLGVTTKQRAGLSTVSRSASDEVLLRNHP